MKIGIGLPAYNEEENIGNIIRKLQNKADLVIVCNDGSKDKTGEIAKQMKASVINHIENKGYGSAIASIFSKAKEEELDVLITFDADGQHRIEDIESVLNPILEEQADIVIGSRFLDGMDKNIPKYRKFGVKTITSLSNINSKQKITDSQSGFRAYNKKAIQTITLGEKGMGVSTEILIKSDKLGLKIKEVPIKILYNGKTSTHNAVSHGVSVLMSTLKFISLEHPLKFYGIPGFILITIGLFFIGWTINEYIIIGVFPISVALVGVAGVIMGTILSVTAILLYSIVNLLRENK
jgi:glycosyltransferase involved in cell wall biosynthesis